MKYPDLIRIFPFLRIGKAVKIEDNNKRFSYIRNSNLFPKQINCDGCSHDESNRTIYRYHKCIQWLQIYCNFNGVFSPITSMISDTMIIGLHEIRFRYTNRLTRNARWYGILHWVLITLVGSYISFYWKRHYSVMTVK